MASIKNMLEANTADILEATELLKVLGDRDGQYVWKKLKVGTVGVENPTFTINGSAGTGATVASDSVDLSLIDESFFDGFMNDAENRWFFYDENGLHYYNGTSNYDAVWDSASYTMKLLNNTASFSGTTFHYTGTKTVYHRAEEGVTVEYAVADDENSYPDGGTQDGFYYVKFDPLTAIAENIRKGVSIFDIIGTMSEGVDLTAVLGYSKVIVSHFTHSSRTVSTKNITHGLGEVPNLLIVLSTKNLSAGSNDDLYGMFLQLETPNGTNSPTGFLTRRAGSNTGGIETTTITLSSSNITNSSFNINKANTYFSKGVEYVVIAAKR